MVTAQMNPHGHQILSDAGPMSHFRPTIEVLATSVGAARLALLGGADRIELCENDPQGGTTPSAGTIETVLELAEPHGTPVHVMIRPRGGGFVFDRDEQAVMLRDIGTAVRLGAHGLVVGVLTAVRRRRRQAPARATRRGLPQAGRSRSTAPSMSPARSRSPSRSRSTSGAIAS